MQIITGKSIQAQLAYGPLHFFHRHLPAPPRVSQLPPEEEIHRFHAAQQRAVRSLDRLHERAVQEVGLHAASIFAIHAMLLEDNSYVDSILDCLAHHGTTAEWAIQQVSNNFSTAFADMDSPYMQARGADIRDISNCLLRHLSGMPQPQLLEDRAAILVCDELLPSEMLSLDRHKLLGLVAWNGSTDSHTAMLLRLMKIPALAQVKISHHWDGHMALLDGFSQSLFLDPEPAFLEERGIRTQRERPLAGSVR